MKISISSSKKGQEDTGAISTLIKYTLIAAAFIIIYIILKVIIKRVKALYF